MHVWIFSACVAFTLLGGFSVGFGQEPTALERAVGAFFSAARGEAREKAVEAILKLSPGPERLEALLKKGRDYGEDVPKAWIVKKNRAKDGVERPYHLLVPAGYDPGKKYALVINMHGGVSRPTLIPDNMFSRYRDQMWAQDARAGAYLLVLPLGQKGAEWWSPVGLDNVLGIIDQIKRDYNVDENKIFTTGFSDGASGSFFFSLLWTTPFAGFIPLNGFPPVAQAGGFQAYLPNASNKPMYAVNTTEDGLYPTKIVTPIIETMKAAGAKDLIYKVHENIGHRPDYWPQERENILRFIKENVRNPLPKNLTWETSDSKVGRCHWVKIEKVGEAVSPAPELVKDFNLQRVSRVRIGIYIDQAFAGEGVRIERIAEGETMAKRVDLRAGDVIVEMDGQAVKTFADLRRLLSTKKGGDGVRFKVQRGDEVLNLEDAFGKSKPEPWFVRKDPAGRIAVACEGNRIAVRVRNVARYTLYISRDLFDVGQPIEVSTNGKGSFKGMVEPDTVFMLARAAEDCDRTMVFWGKIEIDLRKAPEEKGDEGDSEF
jgi:predicted esterase